MKMWMKEPSGKHYSKGRMCSDFRLSGLNSHFQAGTEVLSLI